MRKRLTPYQRNPLLVRWALWWRYKPLGYMSAVYYVLWWVLHGCQRFDVGNADIGPLLLTRRRSCEIIWNCSIGRADIRMGRYYTSQEVLEDLEAESRPK